MKIVLKISKLIEMIKNLFTFNVFTRCYEDKDTKLPTLFSLPLLGHSYLFMFGKYSFERLTEAVLDLYKKLGTRFLLKLGKLNLFVTLNPDDAKKLFKMEGKYPGRPTFEALIHYRRHAFGSVGCVPENGEEWFHFRQGFAPLLKLSICHSYKDKHRIVARDFINYIERSKDNSDIIWNTFEHVMKYAIEAIAITCPGIRINCFSEENAGRAEEIIQASNDFMDGLYSTMKGLPLWKVYKNAGYRKLEVAHEIVHNIMNEHMITLKETYEEDPDFVKENHPFMYTLLSNNQFSWRDKVILAMEAFFGGIDATVTTLSLTLHYLAHDLLVQEKARAASDNDESYLKACIKETLRLSPTSGGTARFLPNDIKFDSYTLKKGTMVLAFASGTSLLSEYVDNPTEYRPDRKVDPYISLPFGHGARMCPGRRLAMQEIVILLQEILKEYKLVGIGSPTIGMLYRMNRIPDRNISIKFEKLKQ